MIFSTAIDSFTGTPTFVKRSAPFYGQSSLDHVDRVFTSLESMGFGETVSRDGRIFFIIDAEKFQTSFGSLGLTSKDVQAALSKPSKLTEKSAGGSLW